MPRLREEKLLKKIAVVVKQLREEKGISQQDMYNDTNIHIGRIETAKANLSISTIAVLCKYFNVSISRFMKMVEDL
jgi:transcriptional regulator with XRE-family HTH domain